VISTLRGKVIDRGLGSLVVEVGGVGFHVMVPERTASAAVAPSVNLYTHLNVRETALELFGFSSTDDRAVFRALLGISGVGPRTALAVVSKLTSSDVSAALSAGDVATFQRVPGVGKKTAQRIVIDLAERFDVTPATVALPAGHMAATQDALQGLIALGYSEAHARKAVSAAHKALAGESGDEEPDASQLLRQSLQALRS
jgi:Holliday junction DNA helicase RuvA